MLQITLTTENYITKPNTKNGWLLSKSETKNIDKKHYENCSSADTSKFFRRLGGTETITKSHTCNGYCPTRIISTSPDRKSKTIRNFNFEWIEA